MKTDLHLVFPGKCTEAFTFYEKTFKSKVDFKMTYGEAPPGAPVPEDAKDLVMHMSMPLGTMLLMGCDAPPSMGVPTMGGFHISVSDANADEVERIFDELKEGGSVQMPLGKTFWSPLFGMCTDKYGVEWMLSVPGPQM
jgi:PhnB protein